MISGDLLLYVFQKDKIKLDKPIFIGLTVLELSKGLFNAFLKDFLFLNISDSLDV